MDWQVVFSARSKSDLKEIVAFIALDDPAAARRFGGALIEKAEALASAPEMGPTLPQKLNTRFFPVGAYFSIYRPDPERRIVRILRFWHTARHQRPLR